jgi:uncharacterized heparinase superfamily protein
MVLGPQIDWHRDFKSGYLWPFVFYQDVEVTRLWDESDAKVPWELSRGHQLLALARAACLFRDEGYARELESQVESWIDQNPPGIGINWTNAMEVAIRATSWIWAAGTLETWRPLDLRTRTRMVASLQSHGRHIEANLEGGPRYRGNHFLADVLGLFVLGTALSADPQAPRWRRFARRALEREIRKQVLPDGVSFEASLPYHGLVLEMLLLARWLSAEERKPFSAGFDARLRRMLEVSRSVRHPNGRVPQFGDNDSGRILPSTRRRTPSQDHLLWLGAAVLGGMRPSEAPPSAEVPWIAGLEAWQRCTSLPGPVAKERSVTFPDGGLYVLTGGSVHVVVRCGDVGQNGIGGHGHNDALSFELSHGGVPIVVDSGTYLYTSDIRARNEFRSTAAHNTVMVNGEEINPIEPDQPFRLRQVARLRREAWEADHSQIRFVGAHDGYSRLPTPVNHRREVRVDSNWGVVEITDSLLGQGTCETIQSFIHLTPAADASAIGSHSFLVRTPGAEMEVLYSGALETRVEEGWVSDSYGARERALVLVASMRGQLPATMRTRFVPVRPAPPQAQAG